jgi:hypothetical protein
VEIAERSNGLGKELERDDFGVDDLGMAKDEEGIATGHLRSVKL